MRARDIDDAFFDKSSQRVIHTLPTTPNELRKLSLRERQLSPEYLAQSTEPTQQPLFQAAIHLLSQHLLQFEDPTGELPLEQTLNPRIRLE